METALKIKSNFGILARVARCRNYDPGTCDKHQNKNKNSWYASKGCRVQKLGPWVWFCGGCSTGWSLGEYSKNIEPCTHYARTVHAPCAHRATTPPRPFCHPSGVASLVLSALCNIRSPRKGLDPRITHDQGHLAWLYIAEFLSSVVEMRGYNQRHRHMGPLCRDVPVAGVHSLLNIFLGCALASPDPQP